MRLREDVDGLRPYDAPFCRLSFLKAAHVLFWIELPETEGIISSQMYSQDSVTHNISA